MWGLTVVGLYIQYGLAGYLVPWMPWVSFLIGLWTLLFTWLFLDPPKGQEFILTVGRTASTFYCMRLCEIAWESISANNRVAAKTDGGDGKEKRPLQLSTFVRVFNVFAYCDLRYATRIPIFSISFYVLFLLLLQFALIRIAIFVATSFFNTEILLSSTTSTSLDAFFYFLAIERWSCQFLSLTLMRWICGGVIIYAGIGFFDCALQLSYAFLFGLKVVPDYENPTSQHKITISSPTEKDSTRTFTFTITKRVLGVAMESRDAAAIEEILLHALQRKRPWDMGLHCYFP